MSAPVISTTPTAQTVQPAAASMRPEPPVAPPATVTRAPLALLPQFATTPKRGKSARPRQEPLTLFAYALETGGRIELTDATKQELAARGVPPHRISSAVYSLKKYFGQPVVTERRGRGASAYVVVL